MLIATVASSFAVGLKEGDGLYRGLLDLFVRLFDSILHVSSYVRIAAVSITHMVFSDLILRAYRPGPVGFAAWLLLTLLLIVVVETLFASIQVLRLHWAEWFYNSINSQTVIHLAP
ncbi:MAG: hypothetical protein MAG715_00004 [Methanonatronarchaeales archaeon]|nr:hypothetical protein [Methanonatronarchaeales archaeon]